MTGDITRDPKVLFRPSVWDLEYGMKFRVLGTARRIYIVQEIDMYSKTVRFLRHEADGSPCTTSRFSGNPAECSMSFDTVVNAIRNGGIYWID